MSDSTPANSSAPDASRYPPSRPATSSADSPGLVMVPRVVFPLNGAPQRAQTRIPAGTGSPQVAHRRSSFIEYIPHLLQCEHW